MAEQWDVVVIGGGSGGFAAAMRAAQLGGRVTLVEDARWGGNCLNRACIPSKFLMAAVRTAVSIRKAGRLGLRAGEPEMDLVALHERQDVLIESLRLGTRQLLLDRGVRLIEGRGRLAAPHIVEANGERIMARSVIVATGSTAAQWPVEGADLPGVLGSEEAVQVRELPARLAILAGAPWDLEMAQFYQVMGCQVTLIVPGPQLLPEADRELAQRLGKLFHDAGMIIKRGIPVEAIRPAPGGALAVVFGQGQGEIIVDRVVAARRLPNCSGLGLRELGVRMEQGAAVVDQHMATSVAGVFAVGDACVSPGSLSSTGGKGTNVTPGLMWSHKAAAEGAVAAESALGRASRMDYRALPRCLYTWPEVAWVGLTEEQAAAQGIGVQIGVTPMAINPYAMLVDETAGAIKVIAAARYGKLLGVHIMGPGAVDLINTAALAIRTECTVGDLMGLIPMHPAAGEVLVDAALDVERRSLHLPAGWAG